MRLFEKHWDHLGKYSQMRRNRLYLMDGAIGEGPAGNRLIIWLLTIASQPPAFPLSIYAMPSLLFVSVCSKIRGNDQEQADSHAPGRFILSGIAKWQSCAVQFFCCQNDSEHPHESLPVNIPKRALSYRAWPAPVHRDFPSGQATRFAG